MNDIKSLYQREQEKYEALSTALRKRYLRISLLRLLFFIAAVAAAIWLFSWNLPVALVFIFLFLAIFYRFIQWHQSLQHEAEFCAKLSLINSREISGLLHNYQDFPSGVQYQSGSHSYTPDLDIFGPYSLYQYICRANTQPGKQRLAEYLSEPASLSEIQFRQNVISELKELRTWRQKLMAFGMSVVEEPEHLKKLTSWLESKDFVLGRFWFQLLLVLGPLWFFAVLAAWGFFLPWQVAVLLLLPIGILLKLSLSAVEKIHLSTTHAAGILDKYAGLIGHIETAEFKSAELLQLQNRLVLNPGKVSAEFKKLDYIIRQLNVRYNFFAVFLNISLLWDLQWVYRLEKWKNKHKKSLEGWFDVLAEVEALSSLANMWFNNPEWCLPELHDKPLLESQDLGHPLIHYSKRISNDFSMPLKGHIKLITGSNMAGKSTFLRTVGINMVLALAGAPVCARSFKMPLLQVFTSMRTSDTLHENTSSFYAELKRLKIIINAVKKAVGDESQVFFLLDEILKGTNSTDRHTGSQALIAQLLRLEGAGFIATHDLELGKMESNYPDAIENLCMEVEVVEGELLFDYKLKPGISKSFNATLLMQQMGIEMNESPLQTRSQE